MARLIGVFMGLVVMGCPASHPLDAVDGGDGAAVDASSRVDAGMRDAGMRDAEPSCPDADEDGHRDARCGGDDCDDSDPRISPARAPCTSPTERTACEMTTRTTTACPAAMPSCDHRTHTCTTDACGDGVLHAGEECDDGNTVSFDGCSDTCVMEPCDDSTECPTWASSCSDHRDDGLTYCRPPIPTGGALGTRCELDTECASGWCDLTQGRCTARCTDTDQCGSETYRYCQTPTGWNPPRRCTWGCRYHDDCGPGRACNLAPYSPGAYTMCVLGEPSPFGEPCGTLRRECTGGVCVPLEGCTAACFGPDDCPSGYTCEPFGMVEYPAEWGLGVVHFCRTDSSGGE
jgi:cysteine-rich repeat protein